MEIKPPKILIVDDEPDLEMLIRQKFRKEIREGLYDFHFAGNGVEALLKLSDHPDIGLVLTDINMPEMDGLTLLSRIKALNNPLLHSVIVSAYGDINNIRTAMNGGAYDFVIKPIDFTDLEITIKKALGNLEAFRNVLQSRDELISVRKELEEARTLQLSMLPSQIPVHADIEIAAWLKTASEVGGDYYDFSFPSDGSLNLGIGDATGHGMKAGIMVSIMKTLFVSDSETYEIVPFFHACNQTIKSLNLGRMMMAFGMINIFNGQVRYVNAGMPPVLHLHQGKISEIENQFMPFGSMALQKFTEAGFTIASGDTLLFFSDGLPELFNDDNEQFGYSRIQDLLLKSDGQPAKAIMDIFLDAITAWSGDKDPDDDITLLVIRRQ